MPKHRKRGLRREASENSHPLISVCMIVKNEEDNIERCLASVKPVVDEIVVVDTGSTDRTVEVAQRLGASIHHFGWVDDFAAARNEALAHATGQWILQIDADEELSRNGARTIRKVVSEAPSRCWGYYIPEEVYYQQDGNKSLNLAYRLLLFRNHPDLRYRYRIHENIHYSGKAPQPDFLLNDDVLVYHHGYLADAEEMNKKQERNQRLLSVALAENPDDAFNQFNLGKHYYSTGRHTEAVEPLRRAVALCRNPAAGFFVSSYAMLVVSLAQAGMASDVPPTIAEAERRIPAPTADFLCNAGSACQTIGSIEQAMNYYQRAIDVGPARSSSGSDPATYTWRPRFGLGFIYETLGYLASAQTFYEEALTYAPDSPLLNCRLAKVALGQNAPARSLQFVRQALQATVISEEICLELLEICEALADLAGAGGAQMPDLDESAGVLLRRIKPTPELGARLSGACSRFGQYELGVAAAGATLDRHEDALARVNRGYCYFALGRHQEASEDFGAAMASPSSDPQVLARLNGASTYPRQSDRTPSGPAPSAANSNNAPSDEPSSTPSLLASIIIPVSGGIEHTKRCIEAIADNTPEDLYEVIIVDNASTDGTRDFLSLLSGDVNIISNTENLGFLAACGQGAQAANGKYLVLLSNRAEPQKGWLENLTSLAESDSSIAVVGAKIIRPGGALLEAGAIAFSNGSLSQFGDGANPSDPGVNVIREIDFCSATSVLVRRDVWSEIGGFDTAYQQELYGAADLCFAVRKGGYRVLYQPATTIVYHEEAV